MESLERVENKRNGRDLIQTKKNEKRRKCRAKDDYSSFNELRFQYVGFLAFEEFLPKSRRLVIFNVIELKKCILRKQIKEAILFLIQIKMYSNKYIYFNLINF